MERQAALKLPCTRRDLHIVGPPSSSCVCRFAVGRSLPGRGGVRAGVRSGGRGVVCGGVGDGGVPGCAGPPRQPARRQQPLPGATRERAPRGGSGQPGAFAGRVAARKCLVDSPELGLRTSVPRGEAASPRFARWGAGQRVRRAAPARPDCVSVPSAPGACPASLAPGVHPAPPPRGGVSGAARGQVSRRESRGFAAAKPPWGWSA